MHLSRIALNTKHRETMRALASPQVLHGVIESSFPHSSDGKRERILWRVDYLGGTCYLLVLSMERPDLQHIAKQFGYPSWERQWEIKDYNILLARLKSGQVWRFRLRANPVHSCYMEKDETSLRGKIYAHVTQQQQKKWFFMRAQSCGFLLDENAFSVVQSEWKKFHKGCHTITLRTADIEGILTISDVKCFKKTLLTGIGRAKAYGCGLLTIARYEGRYDE